VDKKVLAIFHHARSVGNVCVKIYSLVIHVVNSGGA